MQSDLEVSAGHSCIPNMTTLYFLSALVSGCDDLPFCLFLVGVLVGAY